MRNIKITLEYCGANYRGWARQPGHLTIEGILLDCLEKIIKEKPDLIVSGRTDAGVNAKGQVFNFLTKKKIPVDGIKRALNTLLPDDIYILKAVETDLEFHSRFSAKKKDYRYVIAKEHSVFENGLVYHCPYKLDLDAMQKAAGLFIGEYNFKKFSLTDRTRKKIKTVRNIYKLDIVSKQNKIILDISGESFLRGMVRLIGGILVDVGRGRIGLDVVEKALKGSIPMKEKWLLLPAGGLYLMKVYY
ncbi:MAG: tRNA pseudouridine(38-40) synthase TruA [bacterium]|nr:tRNA pseudouridine(38-40) synthase TruA [bacterium]